METKLHIISHENILEDSLLNIMIESDFKYFLNEIIKELDNSCDLWNSDIYSELYHTYTIRNSKVYKNEVLNNLIRAIERKYPNSTKEHFQEYFKYVTERYYETFR